jgi:glycosyltransferase involved in cell wall biosynthesis
MKISGFSFARNAVSLHYPIQESIRSILPICSEFIVAIGKGSADDTTKDAVMAIGDPKIRIIDAEWTDREKLKGKIHAQQTNIALNECTGDWCFYLQADEVIHEDDLPIIETRCRKFLDDKRVEGLLFNYIHLWGDYDHYHDSHAFYRNEIRVIRNGLGIQSWSTAQSFRYPKGKKLQVAPANARIFHYGWVRPPRLMQKKRHAFRTTHHGKEKIEKEIQRDPEEFDYGPLNRLAVFTGTHPEVMKDQIARMDWKDQLRESDPPGTVRKPEKDETLKYRLLTRIETMTGLNLQHKTWRKLLKI